MIDPATDPAIHAALLYGIAGFVLLIAFWVIKSVVSHVIAHYLTKKVVRWGRQKKEADK